MYKINQIVKAVVTGWTKYGVFVNLKDGYTGMIHISELDTAFVNDIGKYVTNKEEHLTFNQRVWDSSSQQDTILKN